MNRLCLIKRLTEARLKISVDDALYYHYKNPGKHYRVDKVAINEADPSSLVVIYTEADTQEPLLTWSRPIESWLELMEDGQSRFTRVDRE